MKNYIKYNYTLLCQPVLYIAYTCYNRWAINYFTINISVSPYFYLSLFYIHNFLNNNTTLQNKAQHHHHQGKQDDTGFSS